MPTRGLVCLFVVCLFVVCFWAVAALAYSPPPGWSWDVRLTNDAHVSQLPRIAANGVNIHVVYQDSRSSYD